MEQELLARIDQMRGWDVLAASCVILILFWILVEPKVEQKVVGRRKKK